MGCPRKIAILIAITLFAGTTFFLHSQQEAKPVFKPATLFAKLADVPGWRVSTTIPLDYAIVKVLELDDYIYQQYQNGNSIVTLYIGYYFSLVKIGSAHDPLVCFPGQGWVLSGRGQKKLNVPGSLGTINYATMTASRGVEKNRILYWFQAADVTIADTFGQKIAAFMAKVGGKGGENAFVRMSCSASEGDEGCDQVMQEFAINFYPLFLQYISSK